MIAYSGFLNPQKRGGKVKTKNWFKFPELFLWNHVLCPQMGSNLEEEKLNCLL